MHNAIPEAGYGSFREELQSLPRMHRIVVYIGLVFMICLFLESIFILPTIILKWGWGFSVG
jgi:hypothetical protein